ncbi:MAG: hypothetical protein HRF43_05235 [Phycisphaerae bacterium]|jgi:hypothetical protein
MMKFFRRHTKHLLAVFMALLLIVWLLDDFLQSLGRGSELMEMPWGTVYGQEVSNMTAAGTRRDCEILSSLGIPWNSFWGPGFGGQLRNDPLTDREWYMLDAEARRRGLYVPRADVDSTRNGLDASRIETARSKLKASLEEIDHAIESFLRVQYSWYADMRSAMVSEADIADFIRQTGEKARVKLVVLEPGRFVDSAYEPTPQELQEQFDKYKDKDRPEFAGGADFGYRWPAEVQVEYLAVHVEPLAEKQQISEDDAYRYWKEHQREFLAPATAPATTQPARPPVRLPYTEYTPARAEVFKKLRTERARREALSIATEIAKTLNRPWLNQPATQPGGYRQPPDGAIDPQLYPRTRDEFRARHGDVITFERTQFHSLADFEVLRQPANATALRGTPQQIQLKEAAFLVQGLEADRASRPQHTNFFHNLFETVAEPFVDDEGNAYVFRTIAIRPAHPPASLEEVRATVVADVRRLKAAETAKQKAADLVETARKTGLDAAVEQDAVLKEKLGPQAVATPPPFARKQSFGMGRMFPSFVGPVGSDPRFIDLVFSMSAATATQPSRVALYAPENEQRWIVVELLEILPVTEAEYTQQRESLRRAALQGKQMAIAQIWLSPRGIRERVQWKPAHPEEEKKEAEEAEATLLDL